MLKVRRSAERDSEHQLVPIAGCDLAVQLRRSVRRTLSLRVDEQGLQVRAPHEVDLGTVAAFVRAHAEWIGRQQVRLERAQREARIVVGDGLGLRLFDEACRVRLVEARQRPGWRQTADGEELLLPQDCPLPALERAVRQRAHAWFSRRVSVYCARIGAPVPPVALSSARRRWGSCSQRSGIRLHWKLALLPAALADYVVAHEVAHLKEMNHSTRFWALVESLYPAWREARTALRARSAWLPEFITAAACGDMVGEDSR
ncbi:MAG: M48 family metallopeptidase [Rhodocyclaceae bacterium]|nr:M48 family metallopeptidase [Rhodocyclaceae bacterium]